MPENPPTPPAAPAKPKRTRSAVNQAWVAELTQAGELVTVASKTEYATQMADEEIDAAWITALNAKITAAQALLNTATGGTADKATATRDEEKLKEDLLSALRQVQQRAKRKYKPNNPQRQKYFINANIADNRATLEEAVDSVLLTLAADTLPGLKPAHKTALEAALAAYKAIQTVQTSAQGDATGARGQLEAKITEIADLRREIQYAADVLWPADNPANAGIRGEFQIPPDKALA